jgi:hypothetical protein
VNTKVPGYIYYNSSGVLNTGTIYMMPVSFPDGTVASDPNNQLGSQPVPQATIPVLVVDTGYVKCGAGHNSPKECNGVTKNTVIKLQETPTTAMMGVGFSRNSNQMPDGIAGANPFLNLTPMTNSAMRAGYIITPNGVTLGLTGTNTAGYTFGQIAQGTAPDAAFYASLPGYISGQGFTAYSQSLTGSAMNLPAWLSSYSGAKPLTLNEWQPLPGCVQVSGTVGTVSGCGQVLMDTGVSDMFIHIPSTTYNGSVDLTQNTVTVSILRQNSADLTTPASAQAAFQFGNTVPGGIPNTVSVYLDAGTASTSFINSSVWSLALFNYMFDGVGGFVGLQPTNALAGAYAQTPAAQ